DNSCSTGLLETSNQKNIPKFLVVRDELPANHQGRARMPIPQNWIIFLWSSLIGQKYLFTVIASEGKQSQPW
ncbi:MAG: hypothetical protein NTY89_06045, partial [Nostocales cyanobacterium LacPavin_0920_SED1_MAG_38_18]|nr:hypothetical protein [Nostocales cyanobacterium LacPavin_0920_SED1_MAG_38_18]